MCRQFQNIPLLTECHLLSDSAAINISLLRSEEQEETINLSSLWKSEMFIDVDSLKLSLLC